MDDVRARAAAAEVVVVERRKIVVDEGERVHELDRRSSRKRALDLPSGSLGDGQAEDGPDPLSARLERVPQNGLEAAELFRQWKPHEVLLDDVAELVEATERHPPEYGRS